MQEDSPHDYRSFTSAESNRHRNSNHGRDMTSLFADPRPNPLASKPDMANSDKDALLKGDVDSSEFDWTKHSPHSVFSNHAITPTQKYDTLMHSERSRYMAWFIALVLLSPLVFRYVMGSFRPDSTTTDRYLLPTNATMSVSVSYVNCVPCEFTSGVTLRNIDVTVSDVTVPDRTGNSPSLAIYTSQNFEDWYSFYKPKNAQDAYVTDYDLTTFSISNASLGCLGNVYSNYLVVCLNNKNLVTTLDLGDSVGKPPFNDDCFQLTSACGTTCVDSTSGGGQYPVNCNAGTIPESKLVTEKSETLSSGSADIDWGGDLHFIEWFILLVIFFDTIGNILKALPMASGRPTELESSRHCRLDGVTVLGLSSPFVSEDEAVFLRSLLGRTCTMLRTISGRHSLQALYVDTILNEKRGPGEKARYHLWVAWLQFLEKMAALPRDDALPADSIDPDESADILASSTEKRLSSSLSRGVDSAVHDDHHASRYSQSSQRSGNSITRSANSMAYFRNLSTSHILATSNPGKIVLESGADPIDPRESVFSGGRLSIAEHDLPPRHSIESRRPSLRPRGDTMSSYTGMSSSAAAEAVSAEPGRQAMNGAAHLEASIIYENGKTVDQVDIFLENKAYTMAQLAPLLAFLDGWLHIVKKTEWTFDYFDKASSLDSLFSAAPIENFYDDTSLAVGSSYLRELIETFHAVSGGTFPGSSGPPPSYPIFPDEVTEHVWTVKRSGLPDWTVHWTYFSRARIIPDPKAANDESSILKAFRSNYGPPDTLMESTRVQRGAVVWMHPDYSSKQALFSSAWLQARDEPYKVDSVTRSTQGTSVSLLPMKSGGHNLDIETNESSIISVEPAKVNCNVHKVSLLEQNRGKAGALNVSLQYLKTKAAEWCYDNQFDENKIQVFMGIVDARHMLAEPDIFWNDSLPFFSGLKSGHASKDFNGDSTTGRQLCINVQFPQFFSNVSRDDFLDNKNSAYYTIWQTLRDSAKATTSSGTNAIWDVTNPNFQFATTSRIEDTGTSQKYLAKHVSVHLPCFVSYGVAKQTGDYIEAVYRWSTGAVELFWATFLSPEISHYVVIGAISFLFGLACFWESIIGYIAWVCFLVLLAFQANRDKASGVKPLRKLVVSSIIVMNTMYWISNLCSIAWLIVMPIRIAFYGEVPMSKTVERSLFWAFAAMILRLPPALMADRLASMCRFLSPETTGWNYSMVMWRSSQLYSCSFAYTFLSVISGTLNAANAYFFGKDLTMWSSFLVKATEFEKAAKRISDQKTICSMGFFSALWAYFILSLKNFLASLTMPETLTKLFALCLFVLQIVCLVVSFYVTNRKDVTAVFVTLLICGLNLFLVIDITILLFPSITYVIGQPARPEYIFAFLGLIILAATLDQESVTLDNIKDYLMFEF